jgi:hypothetical protein
LSLVLAGYPYGTQFGNKQDNGGYAKMRGDWNNNKMELMNGEIRDREKVTRNFKKTESPVLVGYQLHHNYVRPHMALENRTPAEKAGITVKGRNKWLTLIQNASSNKYS